MSVKSYSSVPDPGTPTICSYRMKKKKKHDEIVGCSTPPREILSSVRTRFLWGIGGEYFQQGCRDSRKVDAKSSTTRALRVLLGTSRSEDSTKGLEGEEVEREAVKSN